MSAARRGTATGGTPPTAKPGHYGYLGITPEKMKRPIPGAHKAHGTHKAHAGHARKGR